MTLVLQEQSRDGGEKREELNVQLNFSEVLSVTWGRKAGSGWSPVDIPGFGFV